MQEVKEMKQEKADTEKQKIMKRKIGKTTFIVSLHFNRNSTETVQDKLRRIIINDCMNGKEIPD